MNKEPRSSAKRRGSPTKRRSSTARIRLKRADLAALKQLDRLLEQRREIEHLAQMTPLKRLSPQDLPPGIRTDALPLAGGGSVYCFVHERLGMLGNLILSPADITGTRVSVELASQDPDTPEWAERYDLFNQVATICLHALPGGDRTNTLPPLEEARSQQRLYQRFIACQHSIEMFALVKSLSEHAYHQLLAVIQTALITANPSDRIGIEQRLGELQFYWDDLQARPNVEPGEQQ